MPHDLKRSSTRKRQDRELAEKHKTCRYASMEREKHREIAERQFRHKPYGMGADH